MKRRKRTHYEPTAVYAMAARVKARGIDLTQAIGPWRPMGRRRSRPGGVITNEHTKIIVDSGERAEDVAGLLNWCGVHDLNPVPDLLPRESGAYESAAPENGASEGGP